MSKHAVTGTLQAADMCAAWAEVQKKHPDCDRARIRVKEDKQHRQGDCRKFSYLVYV